MKTESQSGAQREGFGAIYLAANIEISYHTKDGILYCDWIGHQSEDKLKEAGEKIIQVLTEKNCSTVLNDNTRVIGHWYHSVDWTNTDWFPRMVQAGLTKFAWICSDDVFTQLSAKRAIPQNEIVRVFNNHDEALKWLTEP